MPHDSAIAASGLAPEPLSGEPMPRQFGKYMLLSRLSAGGMAEIFLALQRSAIGFEKLVVIKRILPSKSHDRMFIDMFLHEARVAATLSHPNIVQTFDAGEIDGTYFIAMEHVHGEDVRTLLGAARQRGTPAMPLEHALCATLGVCAGLAYMHEKCDLAGVPLGIVHRDISTRNIVVGFTGDVKIVDFGVAQSEYNESENSTDRRLRGKIPYMSPEQVKGQVVDSRSDVFAAGIVLFEMTTGQPLFKGSSDIETLRMIRDSEYPRPRDVKPDYPPGLERIVTRALRKKPEDRYPSARAMQSDIEELVRDARIPVSSVGLAEWMQTLFARKLARHKETLQGVKQLLTVISTEQKHWAVDVGAAPTTMTAIPTSVPPATMSLPLVARAALGPSVIPVAGTVVVACGFLYTQHDMAARQAELFQMYREEQAIRQPGVTPAPELRGAIEINSHPEGCAIWLNGDLQPDVTPTTLVKVPIGREAHIKLANDGFVPYRTTLKLTEDAPFKEIEAELKAIPFTVVLRVDPFANVWVDGKMWSGDRSKIEGLSAQEEHRLVIAAGGYVAKAIHVTAKAGETKTFDAHLRKAEPPPPPVVSDGGQQGIVALPY